MKMVRLSALRIGRLYPPGNIPGTHFCYRLSVPQGNSAAGRIMSMKNSNDTIGNRTRNLPTCSAVPQPSTPPRVPPPTHTPYTVPRNIYYTPGIIFFLQLQGPQHITRTTETPLCRHWTADMRAVTNTV